MCASGSPATAVKRAAESREKEHKRSRGGGVGAVTCSTYPGCGTGQLNEITRRKRSSGPPRGRTKDGPAGAAVAGVK